MGELLRVLLENIKESYELLESLECYYHLLFKMKDKFVLSLSPLIKEFVKLWIGYQGRLSSSDSIPHSHET